MSAGTSRPDLAAQNTVIRLTDAEVCENLTGVLGAKLVAYIGSVRETRTVQQWISGERELSLDATRRFRAALHIALLLSEKESIAVVQAWFQGMNLHLGDVAPARLLREGDLEKTGSQVLEAARGFASGD